MAVANPTRRVAVPQIHARDKSSTIPVPAISVIAEQAAFSVYAKVTAVGNTATGVAGYFESQLSGALADGLTLYGGGFKVRALASSSTVGGGSIVTPLRNSISDVSGVVWDTGTNLVFGMKAECVLSGTVTTTGIYPFSVNSNQTIRALFYCQDTGGDVGYLANAGTSSTKEGDVPLFADSTGGQHYVRIYDARG